MYLSVPLLWRYSAQGSTTHRSVARDSCSVSMVFTTALEGVDMRLLRVIVMVLRLCPRIHGIACRGGSNKGRHQSPACRTGVRARGLTDGKRRDEVGRVGREPPRAVEEVPVECATERGLPVGRHGCSQRRKRSATQREGCAKRVVPDGQVVAKHDTSGS